MEEIDGVEKKEFTIGTNPCAEIDMPESDKWVEFVGKLTEEDVQNGSVLVFRINTREYPNDVLQKVTASINQAVKDLFKGQVKAIIVPDTIQVDILKDLLKENIKDGE